MSAPARDGPETPAEKKGLSKIVSRMKTVLKRSDGSKRLSFSGKPTAAAPSVSKPAEPIVETPEKKVPEGVTVVKRSQVEAERAQKLAQRLGITIDPLDKPDREAYRVEKPIRMRIHRTCHRCGTTFGVNRTCAQCDHTRCKQCPRYPVKKAKTDKGKAKETTTATGGPVGGIEADNYYNLGEEIILTKPNPKPHGQPLVRKSPRQRVRRTCCRCSNLFLGGSKICTNCEHARCTDCPRDPAKKKNYPDGYPGDRPSDNTALPVKYSCHKCLKVYPPVPHPDSPEGIALAASDAPPLICVRCKHPRCADCPRAPPTRVEPEPDPEVLRSVQEKIAALSVRTDEA